MIFTIRTTTGRENVVIKSLVSRIKKRNIPIKAVVHPEELRGYIFIEGDLTSVGEAVQGIPHIRGIIDKPVKIEEIEKFLVPEKQEIKIEAGDIVEIVVGPFKGERGKVTRVDEQKSELTLELLDAAIPIPVTLSMNSLRISEKKKKEKKKIEL
ncbi:MAG: transcription elongation factor Spt5 [Candidatus Aenigmarchaeota archaeon]|nr:transcription elongation factor Spt5 [Candidatus Aenigmarchaeota archaeon]